MSYDVGDLVQGEVSRTVYEYLGNGKYLVLEVNGWYNHTVGQTIVMSNPSVVVVTKKTRGLSDFLNKHK